MRSSRGSKLCCKHRPQLTLSSQAHSVVKAMLGLALSRAMRRRMLLSQVSNGSHPDCLNQAVLCISGKCGIGNSCLGVTNHIWQPVSICTTATHKLPSPRPGSYLSLILVPGASTLQEHSADGIHTPPAFL